MSVRCLSFLLAVIFLLVLFSTEVNAIPPPLDEPPSRAPGGLMSWILHSLGFVPRPSSPSPPPTPPRYSELGPPLPPPPEDFVWPTRPPRYFGDDPNELHNPPPSYSPEPLEREYLDGVRIRDSSPPPRYSRDPPTSQPPSPIPPKRQFEGSSMELVGEDGRDEDGNLLYENMDSSPGRPMSEDFDYESMDENYLDMGFDENHFGEGPSAGATSRRQEPLYDDVESARRASPGANNAHGQAQDSHYDDAGGARASEPLYADVGNGLASAHDVEYADAEFYGSPWEPYYSAGSSRDSNYEAAHDDMTRKPIYYIVDTDDELYADVDNAQDSEEEPFDAESMGKLLVDILVTVMQGMAEEQLMTMIKQDLLEETPRSPTMPMSETPEDQLMTIIKQDLLENLPRSPTMPMQTTIDVYLRKATTLMWTTLVVGIRNTKATMPIQTTLEVRLKEAMMAAQDLLEDIPRSPTTLI
ncbi:hypothetical protein CDD80_2418 [Ophiocordyceps camponoti-rufipedis]|uniref:Uncharacterized protein n=1 Tax=Ophiocordyceps camponoti-rufipedis TaxID=2004952 RepID=A0A2C5ZGR9_9HYPO|nr:hypothetical protein CDD80_2418 [Ophiocordyceps camponoti-rufipedis]